MAKAEDYGKYTVRCGAYTTNVPLRSSTLEKAQQGDATAQHAIVKSFANHLRTLGVISPADAKTIKLSYDMLTLQ